MSEKIEEIAGSAVVKRDLTVNRNVSVRGSTVVDHNLKVKGWLDAPNIKGAMKGLFATVDALKAAYPQPMPGWYALVGQSVPAPLYGVKNGEWYFTGGMGGSTSVSLDSVENELSEVNDQIAGLLVDVEGLESGLEKVQTGHAATAKIVDYYLDDFVTLDELDSFAAPMALPGRTGMRLIAASAGVGGVLFVTGDPWGHCIIETVIGNYSIDDMTASEGDKLTDEHTDGGVSIYTRTYYGPTSGDADKRGTWERWRRLDLRETAGALAQLRSDLTQEVTARGNAFDRVNRLIGDEAKTRNAEDKRVETLVTEEAKKREQGDETLASMISTEASNRKTADETHAAQILELQKALWPIVVTFNVAPTVIEVGTATVVRATWGATCKGANILAQSAVEWQSPSPTASYPAGSAVSSREMSIAPPEPQDYRFAIMVSYNGMSQTATRTVKAVHPSYAGKIASGSDSPTAAQIKAMTKLLNASRGSTQSGITLANQRIVYAYPKSMGALTSVKDGNNYEVLSSYTRAEMEIDGVDYYCYYLTTAVTASGVRQIYS